VPSGKIDFERLNIPLPVHAGFNYIVQKGMDVETYSFDAAQADEINRLNGQCHVLWQRDNESDKVNVKQIDSM